MVSPFFLVALYKAANMVKREQEDMHTVKKIENFIVFQNTLDEYVSYYLILNILLYFLQDFD
jgi:hypothetical protein